MSTTIDSTEIQRHSLSRQEHQIVDAIYGVLKVHTRLCHYWQQLDVRVERTAVVVRGHLPSPNLRAELIQAIRQAGVVWHINNQISVS